MRRSAGCAGTRYARRRPGRRSPAGRRTTSRRTRFSTAPPFAAPGEDVAARTRHALLERLAGIEFRLREPRPTAARRAARRRRFAYESHTSPVEGIDIAIASGPATPSATEPFFYVAFAPRPTSVADEIDDLAELEGGGSGTTRSGSEPFCRDRVHDLRHGIAAGRLGPRFFDSALEQLRTLAGSKKSDIEDEGTVLRPRTRSDASPRSKRGRRDGPIRLSGDAGSYSSALLCSPSASRRPRPGLKNRRAARVFSGSRRDARGESG